MTQAIAVLLNFPRRASSSRIESKVDSAVRAKRARVAKAALNRVEHSHAEAARLALDPHLPAVLVGLVIDHLADPVQALAARIRDRQCGKPALANRFLESLDAWDSRRTLVNTVDLLCVARNLGADVESDVRAILIEQWQAEWLPAFAPD